MGDDRAANVPVGCAPGCVHLAGHGHFSGVLQPPGLIGTGNAFSFEGLEIFSFCGDQACRLNAVYDLATLNKQTGVHKAARSVE